MAAALLALFEEAENPMAWPPTYTYPRWPAHMLSSAYTVALRFACIPMALSRASLPSVLFPRILPGKSKDSIISWSANYGTLPLFSPLVRPPLRHGVAPETTRRLSNQPRYLASSTPSPAQLIEQTHSRRYNYRHYNESSPQINGLR